MLTVTEIDLVLNGSRRKTSPRLAVKLDFSDVKANATVALNNLASLVNDDDELPVDSTMQHADNKLGQVLKLGKAAMQSQFSKSIQAAVPLVDSFVDAVDNVVQVSNPTMY